MPITCDALAARIQEFDDSTTALADPVPGSKMIKGYNSYYYYQAPSYTQGLWRWFVGESRETTKDYLNEMVEQLVKLMEDAEYFLRKNTKIKWNRTLRPILGRHRNYSGTPMTAELIGQIADILAHLDRLTKRLRLVVQYLKETYPEKVMGEGKGNVEKKTNNTEGDVIEANDGNGSSENGSETVSERTTSSSDAVSVFEIWNQRLSEAHATLCEASSSFRP